MLEDNDKITFSLRETNQQRQSVKLRHWPGREAKIIVLLFRAEQRSNNAVLVPFEAGQTWKIEELYSSPSAELYLTEEGAGWSTSWKPQIAGSAMVATPPIERPLKGKSAYAFAG